MASIETPEDLHPATRQQLADIVLNIEALHAEQAELKEKIAAIYSDAAADGFDKKAIRQLVKERTGDFDKTIEHRRVVETYRTALGSLQNTPLGDWARQWMASDRRYDVRRKQSTEAMDEFLKSRSERKTRKPKSGKDDGAGDGVQI